MELFFWLFLLLFFIVVVGILSWGGFIAYTMYKWTSRKDGIW